MVREDVASEALPKLPPSPPPPPLSQTGGLKFPSTPKGFRPTRIFDSFKRRPPGRSIGNFRTELIRRLLKTPTEQPK